MKTLIIYDFVDDDARTCVRERLLDLGLTWIQYSCFMGNLDGEERRRLSSWLRGLVTDEMDSVFVLPLCEKCVRLMDVVSTGKTSLIDAKVLHV